MSIERFFTNTFTIKRMVWSGDSSSQQSVGTFKGHIQEINKEKEQFLHLDFGEAHRLWCPLNTDVMVGDEITDENNDVYIVKEEVKYKISGNTHKELLCEKIKFVSI